MTEQPFELSTPETQSVQAVRKAIARASELAWPLFIALRYRGSAEVNFFDASWHPQLAEFMAQCAGYAFRTIELETDHEGSPPVDFYEIGDSQLRHALEHAFISADLLNALFFSGLIIPALESRESGVYEHSVHAILPPEIFEHLKTCFDVAINAGGSGISF